MDVKNMFNGIKEKVWVYGSLRYGEFNHSMLGENSKYLGTGIVRGYQMYSLGPYPYAIRTDNPKDIITVEGYEVDFWKAYIINNMETQAGYTKEIVEIEIIEGGVTLGNIFTVDFHRVNFGQIKSGDWVKEQLSRYPASDFYG